MASEEKLERIRAYKRAWKKRNPEKVRADNRKRKPTPEQKRAANQRYRLKHPEKLKAKKHAEYLANKARSNAKSKAWAAAHPEKRKAIASAYAKRNPAILLSNVARRRARKLGAPRNDLTVAQWEEIKTAYGYRCVYCGRKLKRLSQDHITPLARGGSHTVSNVVPACLPCNRKKNAGAPLVPVQPMLFTVA